MSEGPGSGPRGGRRRRRLQEQQRRRRGGVVALVGALVVAVLLGGGVVVYLLSRAEPAPPAPAAPAPVAEVECEEPLLVVAAPEISAVLAELAADVDDGQAGGGDGCAAVSVEQAAPGDVAEALVQGWDEAARGPVPDVWVPDSLIWSNYVRSNPRSADLLPGAGESIAQTPTVIGMPQPLAEALGWPDRQLEWDEVLPLIENENAWAEVGHPEWGPFRFGFTDPLRNAAGTHALLSIGAAQSDQWVDAVSTSGLADPIVRLPLLALERNAVERAPSADEQLGELRRADAAGDPWTYLSAFPTAERDLWRYNEGRVGVDGVPPGPPEVRLVALQPTGGAPAFDYPFQILKGADRPRARALLDALLAEQAQRRLQDEGFRDHDNQPGAVLEAAEGLNAERVGAEVEAPDGTAVRGVQGSWRALSQRGTTLFLMDVSGSMTDLVPGTDRTVLQVAGDAAIEGLTLFRDDSSVGLWEFSTELEGGAGGGDHRELVPLGPVGEVLDGVPRRERLDVALRGLEPANDTALYDSILAAYEAVQRANVAGELNSVVVFTDGRSDGDDLTLDALLGRLRELRDRARPTQVVAIAYGPEPDAASLGSITEVTGGRVFTPSSSEELGAAFLEVLTGH